jgi:hypothetical protein
MERKRTQSISHLEPILWIVSYWPLSVVFHVTTWHICGTINVTCTSSKANILSWPLLTKLVPVLFLIDSTKFLNYICYITSNSNMIVVDDVEMWKRASWHILKYNVIIPAFGWTLWIKSQTYPLGWKLCFRKSEQDLLHREACRCMWVV